MGTRRFDLEIGHVRQTTAQLLSITSSKFEDDWISSPHSHYFTEIFYIKSGKGHMQIENKILSIQADYVIAINAYVQHTEISSPADPLDYYVIGVDGLQITNEANSDYSMINCSGRHPAIRQCFENIHAEMQGKQESYREICQSYLEILVLQITRKGCISYDITDRPQNNCRECHRIKRYIEENYHDKVTLEQLAEASNLSKYYLSHKFTELYGKPPIAYLTQVRIMMCKDLLKTTDHSIVEIAEMTGFSSSSYFSQTFQRLCHMSPQQYRKLHKE